MRITRLKLTNFIGIEHGLGRKEVEISFPNKNRVTMLSGSNGSGKSTILSQLQPFKDSFDDRKNLILDGCEGRKEIDIEHNGSIYKIVHIYADSAQSFIEKDGVELNENGGVRTAEEIILKELGISKDYFKIGKIASNTKNFIDYTTAERKAYIGTFLNIEEMLEKFNIARTKYTTFKKDITSVGNELSSLGDKSIVEKQIENFSEMVVKSEKVLTGLYSQNGVVTNKIEEVEKEISGKNLQDEENNLKNLEKNFENSKLTKTSFEEAHGEISEEELEKKIDEIREEHSKIQADVQVNEAERRNLNTVLSDLRNQIEKNKLELSSLGKEGDLAQVQKDIADYQKQEDELKQKVITSRTGRIINQLKKDGKNPVQYLSKFKEFTDLLEEYFQELRRGDFVPDRPNIVCFFDDDFEPRLKGMIAATRKAIEGKRELLTSKEKDVAQLETFLGQLENLEKRPSNCTINDCPFIREAYLHRDVPKQIEEKNDEIKKIKDEIKVIEDKGEALRSVENLFKTFGSAYVNLSPRDNSVYLEFIKEKSLQDWICGPLNEFVTARQELISDTNLSIENIEKFVATHNKLASLRTTEAALMKSDAGARERYENTIRELEAKYSSEETKFNSYKSEGEKLDDAFKDKTKELSEYRNYQTALREIAKEEKMISELKSSIESLKKFLAELTSLTNQARELQEKIRDSESIKKQNQQQNEDAKIKLAQIQVLANKLDTLNKEFEPVETVMNSLSPASGIPLILIQVYLEETQKIANELLSLAYNGEFEIQFETGPKDFFIRVRAKENIKPDIKIASQGEISLATLSISLALIEQSISQYNILCLDEIDGPLDASNRENFISILTSQIEKLGIEQVFVISHNNAFDNCNLDLVLLKNSPFENANPEIMKNKNIIFQYTE